MNTSLVTGGAGFIGSHLCDRLLKEGHKVICVDNLISGNEENIGHLEDNKHFTFIEHNVVEPFEIDEDIDFVFHFASPASPNHHSDISYHALPMETMMVNTIGTKNMLELAREKRARFMFSSTSEIYGDPEVHPQPETYNGNASTTGPRSVYDEAKRFGETLTAYYQRDKNVDTRLVRIFNTYGPRMLKKDKRMIINFINQALANEDITVYGDGKQTRSLCYIDDLLDGIITYMFDDSLSGEIINIGSTEEHTVKEYADMIKELTNSSSEVELSEELPKDDPLKRKPDTTKAQKLLGWKPKTPLKEGLKNTIDYFTQ